VLCFQEMGTVLFIEGCKGVGSPHVELQQHFSRSTEPHGPFAPQDRTNPSYASGISKQTSPSLLAQASYLLSSRVFLIIPTITREPGRQAFHMLNPSSSRPQSTQNTFHAARSYVCPKRNISAPAGQNHDAFAVQVFLSPRFTELYRGRKKIQG